jgi:CMP-N,N'-diacetyllegionaminic acid synthase
MKFLGLIPARGGSKGIPGKNIRPLEGKPLIQRAFESAAESGSMDRIILSTDDPEIAAVAEGFGLEVPFLRPPQFSSDTSPMIDVAVHALNTLAEGGYIPDAVFLLQPTSPLRKPEHIRKAVEILGDNDSVCSVLALPKDLCPHYVMKIREDGFLDYFLPDGHLYTRRQDVPQAYRREGTIFLTRASVILEKRSFYGDTCVPLVITEEEALNIDHPAEWAEAENRLRSQPGAAG